MMEDKLDPSLFTDFQKRQPCSFNPIYPEGTGLKKKKAAVFDEQKNAELLVS